MTFGFPKPLKGSALAARKQRGLEQDAHEERELNAAKKRDDFKCRFPSCVNKRLDLPIDGCHRRDMHRGMGGNPDGSRTQRKWAIALCRLDHSRYDRGFIDIEPLDADLYFDGPCAFYDKDNETGRMVHIATETTIGVSVAVGA